MTDIAIIDADELSEPSGFLLLEKVLNGSLPANLNQGSEGKNLYLTYRRVRPPSLTRITVMLRSNTTTQLGPQEAPHHCLGCDLPCIG